MNSQFVVDDYALIWNLLFQASKSENLSRLKEKLWETYKIEYNKTYKDKMAIMEDAKNFIPDDDLIYNNVLDSPYYGKIRKQAEKYRLEVMEVWDKNKKETNFLMKDILRMELPDYTFFVVNKELGIIDHPMLGRMVLGKNVDMKNPYMILYEITLIIFTNIIKPYKVEDRDFKKAIIELAVLNEYATRLNNRSFYLSGDPRLLSLKRWLYPYWLMYLGIPKEEFTKYMERDKIVFDASRYAYEKELKKMNLEEFIDFCIRNQKYIVREQRK